MAHPHLSQALLASGSQIQQSTVVTNQQPVTPQQQQQVVQVVVKDDSRGGVTSSSIIKSLLATKVTVSGDCMPGVAVTCVSSPTACVTNTTATSIASSISANQLITSNQVQSRSSRHGYLTITSFQVTRLLFWPNLWPNLVVLFFIVQWWFSYLTI